MMKINIYIMKQEDLKISPLNFNSSSSFAELQKMIAEKLGVRENDISIRSISGRGVGINKTVTNKQLLLVDYNALDNSVISVLVASEKLIVLDDDVNFIEKDRVLKGQMDKIEAQSGLREALDNAQINEAHTIITVGSYVSEEDSGDKDRVKRQQFPLERLGSISSDEKVHLIHVDPGYQKPNKLQWHEQSGWMPQKQGLVSIYTNGNYTITTIAQAVDNRVEGNAYFERTEPVTTLLDEPLDKYMRMAQKLGKGFISGNFYSEDAPVEVISIFPSNEEKMTMKF